MTRTDPLGSHVPSSDPAARASALFIEVAFERAAGGTKGKDLLGDLQSLLARDDPEDWRDDVDPIADLADWLDKDQVDASRGTRTRAIFGRLVQRDCANQAPCHRAAGVRLTSARWWFRRVRKPL